MERLIAEALRRRPLAAALLAAVVCAAPPIRAENAPPDAGSAGIEALAAQLASRPGAAAAGSVALLPVQITGHSPWAIARPWVVDPDALAEVVQRALARHYAVTIVRSTPSASREADLRALARSGEAAAPAARIGRSLGTGAVVAARVRMADDAGFLSRAPALEIELRLWPTRGNHAAPPVAVRTALRGGETDLFTWNPVLLASFGVGLLALRGRPAGRDVARAARIRAGRGVVAREPDVDLSIPLG